MDNSLIDDCKKFLGVAPYDTWTNIVVGDAHFYKSVCNKYGKQNVDRTIKEIEKKDS